MFSPLPPKICERCEEKTTRISLRASKRLKYCDDCIVKNKRIGFQGGKAQKIRCIECKEKKLFLEFSIDQHHNTGRQRRCKGCAIKYHRRWRKGRALESSTGRAVSPGSRLAILRDKIKLELG